ncbi:DUF6542 domain-containing protein [Kitasatospora kifunensis]|uniref:DUF6542 domain-containing protein n=1 Tax=Kitasatospora kifunensis TaxID=58351 RepID=A0A7W7VUI9_KITKI|nr:DUF6542 domain-containing protein [Kitasatospora kifunensis]MBB4923367.1 hypothetical protein [Kitasatospora kifunensis]
MAGQRASSSIGEAQDQAHPRARARGAQLPSPRRGADAPLSDQTSAAPAGRAAARSRAAAPRARRATAGMTMLAALGLPVIGAFTDELLGSAPGGVFTTLTVLGTAAAAWLATRNGWWWVLTGVAPVVLLSTAGAELLAHRDKYGDTKAVATGAAKWAVHAFPVMGWAMGAAVLVIMIRLALEKNARSKPARERRGRQKENRRG